MSIHIIPVKKLSARALKVVIEEFMKPSRRIPRPVDGDECGAGVRGMQFPSSSFLRCPALWAG